MSIQEDLATVAEELRQARQDMSIAGSVLAASLAAGSVLHCHSADVWRVVACKALIRATRAYTATILAASDQLCEELKAINEKREQDGKRPSK